MFANHNKNYEPKIISFELERNPYTTKIFCKNSKYKDTIVFPIFHYKSESQYVDLITCLLEKNYRVITVCFLHHGDKILNFNYYYHLFESFCKDILVSKIIGNEEIILMGVGVGANLVSYANSFNLKIKKNILISPVNSFKDEYSIANDIAKIKIPTFIYYGQLDKENSVDSRYSIFQKTRNNPNVHFTTYPYAGHLCYYDTLTSLELQMMYHKNNIDVFIGSYKRTQPLFLPNEPKLNELFFKHLFNDLEGKKNPKRILLITETFPMYACGKGTSIEFLAKELNKLGYETYVAGLFRKYDDLTTLKNLYIPIMTSNTKIINNNPNYVTFNLSNPIREAKLLATFGFNYLHLYSDGQMSKVGLELSKMTGIKMPYTYHTLWKLYSKKKINQVIKDTSNSHRFAWEFMKSKVYKESPLIITQSQKSYNLFHLKNKNNKKIIINTTPMNLDNFYFNKSDYYNVEILKKEHGLKGKKIIGYINKVSPEVSTYEIISYFSQLGEKMSNAVLMIIGTGDATKSFMDYAEKLGVASKVIFIKDVTNEERKWYFHLFDAFVSGSDFELQGSPYFEAAYCGVPIIIKENACTEDIFKNGENALVYSNFIEFVNCVEKALFDNNKIIVANAKNLVKKYSPEKWAKQMLAIYKKLN